MMVWVVGTTFTTTYFLYHSFSTGQTTSTRYVFGIRQPLSSVLSALLRVPTLTFRVHQLEFPFSIELYRADGRLSTN